MLDPLGPLSPLQHHLLRELDLCDLPAPEAGPESYATRDLDTDEVRDALPTLLWAGLVEQRDGDRGTLRLTATGAAALRTAECGELAARLGAVSSFADTVARGTAPSAAGHALRLLAEGVWDLEQAEAHVAAGEGA
ncbi:hypothetical protein [Streptomyces griseoaurantiacus]|uniref:MarR family transcriptional regulator n=1 Tax=Streptomyces griseoaurantiacus TaxID=68213 RepID=A0A7W2DS39_9ACTN|nr:hypothetical protein [Streptomyces griseoaurantiacus]MBA5221922.1 hypothetical protein [Streptomyces griseoaurantiacus]